MSEPVEIRSLDEASAEALVACVRRCYGTTYPESDFLDAAAIARQLRSGRLMGKVAVTRTGRVVGHLGTRFDVPGDCVAERRLHKRFAKYHLRSEWFRSNPELLEFARTLGD